MRPASETVRCSQLEALQAKIVLCDEPWTVRSPARTRCATDAAPPSCAASGSPATATRVPSPAPLNRCNETQAMRRRGKSAAASRQRAENPDRGHTTSPPTAQSKRRRASEAMHRRAAISCPGAFARRLILQASRPSRDQGAPSRLARALLPPPYRRTPRVPSPTRIKSRPDRRKKESEKNPLTAPRPVPTLAVPLLQGGAAW